MQGGADSGAPDAETAALAGSNSSVADPRLARLVSAWPILPEAAREHILTVLELALPARTDPIR
jgi:hypothetical protein